MDVVCRELGEEQCQSIEFDVTQYSNYGMLFDRAEKIFGKRITCFVSNAGVYIDKEPLEVMEEDFDKTIAVNLKASVLLVQEYTKYCIKNNIKGTIVVTSSNRGLFGDVIPYGISKYALNNYVMGLGKELIKYGMRINAVAPGMTASEINDINATDNLYRSYVRGERVLRPEEIAEVICFLLSDNSKCINGAIIPCDEGDALR